MKFVTPKADPGFPTNGAHGVDAQQRTIRAALSYCRANRTAVDVGAHIGIWTIALLSKFGHVLAFEPNDENFECLMRNAGSASCFHAALGARSASQTLILPPGGNSGMWHVSPGDGVPVHALDSYGLRDVDFIKIDTEGYEGQVLLGAYDTIDICRPAILFEDNGLGPKYFGTDWVDPKPILESHGYRCAVRIRKDEIWTPR